jgi:peptidyl-dipeptidase Dcp
LIRDPSIQPAAASDPSLVNPILAEWTGPHGGVPPLDRVRVEHFMPALDAAGRAKLEEVERIANDPAPPTFVNTLEAMERAGASLRRVETFATIWRSTMSTPEFQAIEGDMMARLADLEDRIKQNAALFRRIEAVYQSARSQLTAEQRRLAWLYHTDFVRAGAALGDEAKARLAAINRRLAELSTRFDQNVLWDENNQYLLLDSENDLSGLPHPERSSAAAAAEARGFPGKWLIANTRSAVEPFLTYASRRDLRERALRMFLGRGDSPGERDNKPVLAEMLTLRAERARLLGYRSHADWAVEKAMAKTPERAMALMEAVWPHAVGRVRQETQEMRALARSEGMSDALKPWDYRYYAEKVRGPKYDLDWHEVEPYLQLDRLREGMFWVAGRLFGMDFTPVDLPVYHGDVRAWEVKRRGSGRHVGLFYFDPFARPGKKSGAWMNHYRRQERLGGGVTPIVSNNCNYLRGTPGEPVLISWTDAVTLFHEFGHALHGLSSDVTYRSLAGTGVSPDYVEFPSQILEFWLSTPEVLGRFAVHHGTGEPIRQDLVARVERAATAAEGFSTTEQLASGLVDMRLHLSTDPDLDPSAIEIETLAAYGMPSEIAMRHRPSHFAHIFSSDQYAAKYYSYLWADVLAADAREAFLEAGGMYDADVAERLRDEVLARGNTVDPEEGYRAFRGREPNVEALMRKRGFRD